MYTCPCLPTHLEKANLKPAVLVCPFGANDGGFPVLQHKPQLEVCFNSSFRSGGFVVRRPELGLD